VRIALTEPLDGTFRVYLMVDVFAVDEMRLGVSAGLRTE
jgi:hypothetical protein